MTHLLAETEDFWFLLHNLPHWEFEGFLMFLDNVVMGLLLLPIGKKWLKRHDAKKHSGCDICQDPIAEERIAALELKINLLESGVNHD